MDFKNFCSLRLLVYCMVMGHSLNAVVTCSGWVRGENGLCGRFRNPLVTSYQALEDIATTQIFTFLLYCGQLL